MLYFAIYPMQKRTARGRHVFVSNAERARRGFCVFWSGFGEVGGSFAAFFGDDHPAVKKIIFAQFIIWHKFSACTSFVVVLLF
jgi:hypothetical protein